ncbi:MAG: transketolase [Candidatus Xenobia bacterium]
MSLTAAVQTRLEKLGNQLRIDSIIATTAAGSGHPTSCMSAADLVAAVFFHEMRWDPGNPKAPTRDRFVLSKGHAAPLLYSALHEAGAIPGLQLTDLRKFGSPLEGHPSPITLPWVDVATGSLGQGLSAGLGMAVAQRMDGYDSRVYVLLGDGELAEGNVWEAMNLAGHDKVDNLIALLDINALGQSDPTMFEHHMDAYKQRCEAFGWDTQVIDGHDMGQILTALEKARQRNGKPHAIVARTDKGHGVSFLSGKPGWHGKPLSKAEADKAIEEIKAKGVEGGSGIHVERPAPARDGKASGGDGAPPVPSYKKGESHATREAFGDALAAIGKVHPEIVALDGDVKNSTYSEKFKKVYPNRFVECFIAEQNMVAMAAGLSTCGKVPFASTFAAFFSRAYDQIRMAAISQCNVKLVGSHAGVSIGEDGPSQMALEDIAMMRAIPDAAVLYPSDAVSTFRLLEQAVAHRGIVFMRTSRPKTPVIYDANESFPVGGFKVFRPGRGEQAVVVGAGVTLHQALGAQEALKKDGIEVAVVDLYSVKPLDGDALRRLVSECGNRVVVVEDHYPEGGLGDAVLSALSRAHADVWKVAVTSIPHSGTPDEMLKKYGLDAASIAEKVRTVLKS